MPEPSSRARWLLAAWVVVALAWASSPYWTRLADFGPAQTNDYYPTLDLLADEDGWSADPSDWLGIRSNEHRVVLSSLLLRANVALFDGDNRGLSVWSLLMMATSAVALLLLLPPPAPRGYLPWALAAFLVASFATTTVAAVNVAHGFSGTFWHTADALSLLALAAAWRSGRPGRRPRPGLFALALLLAFAASWTYSTGLMAWPALFVLVAGQADARRRLPWLVGLGGVTGTVALLGYGRPGHHPEPNVGADAVGLLEYVEVFVGSLFGADPPAAEAWGHVGWIVLAGVFGLARGAGRSRLLRPWAAVAVYAVGNAVLVGIGRSPLGVRSALSSRYGTLTALFWIAVLVPCVLLLFRAPSLRRGPRRWGAAALVLVAVVGLRSLGAARGTAELETLTATARLQPAAHLALVHGIRDDDLYRLALTPQPEQLWAAREELRALGHVPFDDPPAWPEGELGPRTDAAPEVGVVDGVFPLPGGRVRIQGWIPPPERPLGEVLLADGAGRIAGPAVYGTPRPRVAAEHGEHLAFAGFMGYARVGPGALPRACVRFAGDEVAHCLVSIAKARRQWRDAVAATADVGSAGSRSSR